MFVPFLSKLFTTAKKPCLDQCSKNVEASAAELDGYLGEINLQMYCYPPQPQIYFGKISGALIMRSYMGYLLDRIIYTRGMSDSELRPYVESIVVAVAEIVHILPATENSHYCRPCGLMHYCLDVATLTLDACRLENWDRTLTPKLRHERKLRWHAAGVIASILHNAYVPISDMTITDLDGKNTLLPESETINDWSNRLNIAYYKAQFITKNSRRNGNFSLLLAGQLIPNKTIEWLNETGDDIYQNMLGAIAGNDDSTLSKIVKWAAGTSASCDIQRSVLNWRNSEIGDKKITHERQFIKLDDSVNQSEI